MSYTLWILAQSRLNLNLGSTIYGINLVYFLQKFQNIGWYTSVIWKNNLQKNGICANFCQAVYFFQTQKKNRTIGLWRGMEGSVCGYGEKKKPYPFVHIYTFFTFVFYVFVKKIVDVKYINRFYVYVLFRK